ncbi:MAG: beta-ketoacyl synthase N-terminal-like domain-containing protein [Planctomycetota bacterium]
MTRIVATGAGVLASPGVGREEFWRGILAGGRGPSKVAGWTLRPGAPELVFQVPEFDTKTWIAPAAIRRLDRTGIFAIVAAKLALADARLDLPLHRVAIVVGAGGCGVTTTTGFHRRLVETAGTDPNPMAFPNTVPNAAAGQLAIATGITGFNTTLVQTGASGEEALVLAADLLAQGRCDAAVAGGIDELSSMMHHALHRLGGLSRTACRPFDRAADGTMLAEDAGLIVLERLGDAKKRGARALAELAGYGRASSPARPLAYGPAAAAASAIESALARAGVAASDVAWVNSAANGVSDARCAAAIRAALPRAAVSSVAGSCGEGLAIGGVRAAASVCAVAEATIPPVANLREPAFELDLVREARPLKGAVVQHGAGTGGVDLAIVWRSHA